MDERQRLISKGVRVVPSRSTPLPRYGKQYERCALGDLYDGDESNDVELNRRSEEYERAKTSTFAHVSKTMLKRSVGIMDRCGLFLLIFMAFAIAFLALSMIFEIAYPFDSDPDVLYENARSNLITVQSFSDLALSSANVAVGVVQPLIPMWNAASAYMVEPTIFIMIEIVSLISTGNRELFFRVNETDTPFRGYDCHSSEATLDSDVAERAFSSQAWCGLMGYYVGGVTATETAAMCAMSEKCSEGKGFASRKLRQIANDTFALPPRAARRLVEALRAPTLPFDTITSFTGVVGEFVGYIIELFGLVFDLIFHVIYIVLDETAVLIGTILLDLLRIFGLLIYQLMRSGIIGRVLQIAIDFIIIFVTDIAVPSIFVLIDAIGCMLHLLDVPSWRAELRCAACLAHALRTQ
jgi:hypothetical protein